MKESSLSVVIPALNAAGELPATLAALHKGRVAGLIGEIIVVDGGSGDGTRSLAEAAGARLVEAPSNRGRQLALGGEAAAGGWLLFLHADTVLSAGWAAAARDFMARTGGAERAGVFRLVLDDPDPRARRIERLARWRGRVLGLPYGDQGLLIARGFYRALGGFRPLPLMEDVDLVRRIGRGRLELLDSDALTSAARYRKGGWWLRPLRNLTLLGLFFLGAPTGLLRRLYG
jgi:rSAM/selenodomain-associated transferase 2